MYNEKIESLISAALADGVLTEKEKQILFKRAEEQGIDLDEFEMVLDARLYEKQKETKTSVAAPKTNNSGDVKKCPACGAILESFASVCPMCGAEIRNVDVANCIKQFSEELEQRNAQISIESENDSSKLGCGTILLWWFFWWILIPYHLIRIATSAFRNPKLTPANKRKQNFILNYPIPNSKEDLLEFMSLCVGMIEPIGFIDMLKPKSSEINSWNNIWFKKLCTLETKAKISMKNDTASLNDIQWIIAEGNEKMKSNRKTSELYLLILILLCVAGCFALYLFG